METDGLQHNWILGDVIRVSVWGQSRYNKTNYTKLLSTKYKTMTGQVTVITSTAATACQSVRQC